MAGRRLRGLGRFGLLPLALAMLLLVTASDAGAAPTWLASRDLSAPGQDARAARVALDGAGDVFAVWPEYDGSNTFVQASVRPTGGDWSAAQNLSPAGEDASGTALAVDAAGDAIAAWASSDGKAHAALRPAGGAWGAPQDLSPAAEDAVYPQVALDPAGNSVAVWERFDGSNYRVVGSSRSAGGAWSTPQSISAPNQDADVPQVALDRAGNAVAVWVRTDSTGVAVQAALRPPAGSWGPPQDLSASGQLPSSPQLALDPTGNAVVVWPSEDGIIRAAARPSGGVWSAPQAISTPGDALEPAVAIDPGGNAVAVWDRFNGSNYAVQASRRVGGTTWAPPENLSAAGQNAGSPDVAVDPFGNVGAVWTRYNGSVSIAQATLRPVAAGAWAPPQDLSAAGWDAEYPTIGFDGAGNAAAVWGRSDGSHVVTQASGLDAAGPLLGGIFITGKLTAGGSVGFSPSAMSDVWSSLAGPPHWFFGDGAEADGANVAHVYRKAGYYIVTVSQADAVGNQSSESTGVTITPAPCVVPRVVGQTLARAKRAITKGHCRPGRIGRAFSKRIRTGRVVSQRPRPGKRLRSGARVNLVVSRGPRR